MPMFQRFASLATLGGVLLLFTTPAYAVALIRTQPPCVTASGTQRAFSFARLTSP